ncbi:MAG: hypothetical protein ACFE0I_11040 [Elainellaceae cyanobacterium]
MTGFIRGLFGSKRKQGSGKNASDAAKKPKSYFLSADDAKTYGDIDYMRTAKSVKRTFPKTKTNQGEFSLTKTVSAMEDARSSDQETASTFGQPVSTNNSAPQPTFKDEEKTEQRRRSDTSMDMFRNMARDIRKK